MRELPAGFLTAWYTAARVGGFAGVRTPGYRWRIQKSLRTRMSGPGRVDWTSARRQTLTSLRFSAAWPSPAEPADDSAVTAVSTLARLLAVVQTACLHMRHNNERR